MRLSKDQQEKLTFAIQAALGVLVLLLSVLNSAKTQSASAKKLAKKEAKQIAKLSKSEAKQMAKLKKADYAMQKKLLREKYRTKLRKAKLSGKGPA